MKAFTHIISVLILVMLPFLVSAQTQPDYIWSNGDTTATINVSPPVTTTYYVTVTYGAIVIYDSITVEVDSSTYGTDVVSACGSYMWIDSVIYTSSNNTATDTIPNSAGCDSIITLDLTILPPSYTTLNESACDTFLSPSGSYTWTTSGTYYDTLVNSIGCDSIITVNLTILTGNSSTQTVSACNSYTWSVDGQTYNTTGTYSDTLPSSLGCDSVIVLDLTINNSSSSAETLSICNAYSWPVNGQTYTTSGVYTDTLLNSVNCDSILTLDLTILNNSFATINQVGCDTVQSPSGNYIWTSSGTYTDTLINSLGCDSIITVNLDLGNSSFTTENATACDEYIWAVDGQTYNTSGTYNDTLISSSGCDSVFILNLTINTGTSATTTANTCDDYTWAANGQVYTQSGTYFDTLINTTGCDSFLTLNLTIASSIVNTENTTACDEYTWAVDGQTYNTNGTYTDTLISSSGCDSILVLNLTIATSSLNNSSQTTCDSYIWPVNGQTYNTSGTYRDTLLNSAGCDSVLVLNLTINNSTSVTTTASACDEYVWGANGLTYTSSGTYFDTLVNSSGCDSLLTLDLTVNSNIVSTEDTAACGQYTWAVNGLTYTSGGTYTDTLIASTGCDSVLILNLTLLSGGTGTISETACDTYTWVATGLTYNTSGVYYDTITIANCDTITELTLTILNSTSSSINQSACDSFVSPSGNFTWTTSGTYTDTLVNTVGCDSVVSVNLTINNSSSSTENISACDSYTWLVNGATYNTSGTYSDTLQSNAGCDSILTLVLSLSSSYSGFDTITACNTYTWPVNGATYTNGGTYFDTIFTGLGCDSTFQLDLTLNFNTNSTQNINSCDSYTWPVNGQTYTATGTYNDTLLNTVGCDSIVTLDLTINNSTSSTEIISSCDTYTWLVNGQSYNSSGIYSDTLVGSSNCDSVLILDLTINSNSTFIETVTSCDSYTWSVNNTSYTQSGVYTDTINNTAGCDSIISLDLTILSSSSSTISETACDEYTSPSGNYTWTASGTYTDTVASLSNCDSVITINLTIEQSSSSTQSESACEIYTWSVNGQDYTSSGSYTYTTSNSNGCDSIITLNLQIQNNVVANALEQICDGDSAFIGGTWQVTPGTYSDSFSTSSGCDSIILTELLYYPSDTGFLDISINEGEIFSGELISNDTSLLLHLSSINGCDSIAQINIEVLRENNIYIPNAFTPNGDGINDVFKIYGNNFVSMRLQIFDRWGEKIFETTDFEQGWDGTGLNGVIAPPGAYVYIFRAIVGEEFVKETGQIALIR